MVELKDKTKVTFHKGTHSIGGTLIEISYKDSRIFFDLGSVYHPDLVEKNIDELLEKDLVKFVDGLYDPKAFKNNIKQKKHEFKNQACLISHTHLDHTFIVNFINSNIPIFASTDTVNVLEAISVENDFIFPFTKNQNRSGRNIRKIERVDYYKSIKIKDIKVTFIPVDHDAYGACGFLIETPSIKIAYTGDIRKHGLKKDFTNEFIKIVKNCDLLISEAVSFSFNYLYEDDQKETLKEKEVVEKIIRCLKENQNKQITFNYYPTNFLRIKEIYNKIKGIRKLVLNSFTAYIVKKVLDLDIFYYTINNKNYGLDPKFEISLERILENKKDYFWQMDIKRYDLLNKLEEDSIYIHSNAEPIGEYDPFYKIFMEKFNQKKVLVKIIETSGHAPTRDLFEIISKINPKKLATIHSFHPERVYYKKDRLLNPFDGDKIFF